MTVIEFPSPHLSEQLGHYRFDPPGFVMFAFPSGRSALVAWIILWTLSTLSDTRGIVTANTEGQLRTKTWPELAKWHALSINKSWFTHTATSLQSSRPGRDRTWRVDAITWSENNTEAIAGLHNKGKRAFALFDEASSIADGVWETIVRVRVKGEFPRAGTMQFIDSERVEQAMARELFKDRRRRWSWPSTSSARARTRPSSASAAASMPARSRP
jgi:hypothetical protein